MQLVDTHCHIQSAGMASGERTTRELWAKDPDLSPETILANAVEANVTKLICVGCDLEDSRLAVDFVAERINCWASIGIHPHEAQHFAGQTDRLKAFSDLAERPKVIAIGECGFDFYYTHSPRDEQLAVLMFQLELAQKYKLPLVFHVREAFADFWPAFDQFSGLRGVLHSYTDNQQNLDMALERGLYIGVNGIATFVKDEAQKAVYQAIPANRLLLETDAPFLTPTPYRGSINQPKHVGRVAEFLAEMRGEDSASLAAATTHNAHQLFGI